MIVSTINVARISPIWSVASQAERDIQKRNVQIGLSDWTSIDHVKRIDSTPDTGIYHPHDSQCSSSIKSANAVYHVLCLLSHFWQNFSLSPSRAWGHSPGNFASSGH